MSQIEELIEELVRCAREAELALHFGSAVDWAVADRELEQAEAAIRDALKGLVT